MEKVWKNGTRHQIVDLCPRFVSRLLFEPAAFGIDGVSVFFAANLTFRRGGGKKRKKEEEKRES